MASAAFKSSTRRSSVGNHDDAASSSKPADRRRSRSLSRFSGRVPPPRSDEEFQFPPRGKFVTTARGSGFEEISLDELADEFFAALEFDDAAGRDRARGRPGRRLSDASFLMGTESSRRRGRSVSRKPCLDRVDGSARRRSLSVARYRCCESEGESDISCSSSSLNKSRSLQKRNEQLLTVHKSPGSKSMRRSASQQDLSYLQDNHSTHSSALTDYEPLDFHANIHRSGKTMGTELENKKTEHTAKEGENPGFYEVMRREVRGAVHEIKTELEKVIENSKPSVMSNNGNQLESSAVVQAIAEIRRNYATKLDESERRKQELLAELAAEEQRGKELSKIVKELLPGTNEDIQGRPSRTRKRSTDKSRISKNLFEDAEKYFEDFLSSVEDTDLSSFDGERSDGGSTTARFRKPDIVAQSQPFPLLTETDGLVLPWLEWDASNYETPVSSKIKENYQQNSVQTESSHGSWSPEDTLGNYSEIFKNQMMGAKTKPRVASSFNPDDYIHLERSEEFLLEVLSQRQRINSGGLVLCRGTYF
ncbi:uncharacterized protein LOC144704555 [Wolffia australiana]